MKSNILENTPKNEQPGVKYPPQQPIPLKTNLEERHPIFPDLNVTPKVDFNLTLSSPMNTTNQKVFKTEKTKANLNLMEEGRDSSIYDTITTYTGMMTSAKKDLPSSGTFKFFNSG